MNITRNVSLSDVKSLSEVLTEVISGEWGDDEGEIQVLRTTNFQNDGTINYSNVVKRAIDPKKIKKKALKAGDTIIEKSGGSPTQPVGRVVYFDKADQIFLCNNFTSILRPSKTIDSKYFFWSLFNNHLTGRTLPFQNKTTGIINLKLERYIQEAKIPIPSPLTQKRISEILDKADALRKKDQQLLKYYDDLAESLFIDMFGDPVRNDKAWEKKTLKHVTTKITDGTHFSPPNQEQGIPYITAKHLKKNFIDFDSNPTYISEQHHKEIFSRCSPAYGDVLYIKDGATTGIAAVNEFNFEFSMLSSLALIKTDKNVLNSNYLTNWLNNESVKEQYIRTYMAGAAIRRFTLDKIKRFEILIPPIDLQNQFARQIKNIEQQKQKVKGQIQQSENLFQALLQNAFNGGLN